mmetsp:Transcript_12317/g.23930  ORF Transcript_12317/g.23930 Transcript_12317/m.23930 type:complete len:104 (-) Transcript_12317:121-432(-)
MAVIDFESNIYESKYDDVGEEEEEEEERDPQFDLTYTMVVSRKWIWEMRLRYRQTRYQNDQCYVTGCLLRELIMHLDLQLGQMGLGYFYRDDATTIAPLYAKD